ncbi:hypothetical protein ASE39_07445 [Acidovorax sp. Root267]|nr:hypothetical protein ASE39_07445 [Acidovorax sp. Root267]
MTEENPPVHCDTHGEAVATYVCGHLCRNSAQRWFCDMPSTDCRYPDAWCASCHAELLKEGEWNERNEACLDLQIICHHCYQASMAASVDALDGPVKKAWIDTVATAHQALYEKQRVLESDYGISRFSRWDYDQPTGTLTFSDNGVARVVADIEFIGSVSETTHTWLWAWANFHNQAKVISRIPDVWEFGEDKGFRHLTVPLWKGDATDGWEVSGVAADVLGAQGVYRAPTAHGFLYMALMSVQTVG